MQYGMKGGRQRKGGEGEGIRDSRGENKKQGEETEEKKKTTTNGKQIRGREGYTRYVLCNLHMIEGERYQNRRIYIERYSTVCTVY